MKISPILRKNKTRKTRDVLKKNLTINMGTREKARAVLHTVEEIKNGSNLYAHPLPSDYAVSLVIYSWF